MTCPQCTRDVTSIEDVKVKPLEVEVEYTCRHCTTKWRKTYIDPETEVLDEGG